MTEIQFTVPGVSVGKGAPKFVRQTGRAYTPSKTQAWLALVQSCALEFAPEIPWDGPVGIQIFVTRKLPVSLSSKKRSLAIEGKILPTTKPDCSNYAKGIEDALSGVIYNDDAQIISLQVRKEYGERPGTLVRIWRMGDVT